MEKSAKALHKAVNETSNASITINPTATGWSGYFSAQKEKIEDVDLKVVHEKSTAFILKNRVEKDSKTTSNKPGANKLFRLP